MSQQARILVVDDELPLLNNITSILELFGFQCIRANSGYEGLIQAIAEQPDLVVCDVMMPGIDGYGLLKMLRNYPATKNLPFIFLTALADVIDRKKGMEHGANAYLTKPFNTKELVDLVKLVLADPMQFRL
jgi:DNA-binding response OmpR family regulator